MNKKTVTPAVPVKPTMTAAAKVTPATHQALTVLAAQLGIDRKVLYGLAMRFTLENHDFPAWVRECVRLTTSDMEGRQ